MEHSRYVKLLADDELADTLRLREALFVVRERSKNDILAQRDRVDFILRKRIYQTQKARNEIEWQQLKMREEMQKALATPTPIEYLMIKLTVLGCERNYNVRKRTTSQNRCPQIGRNSTGKSVGTLFGNINDLYDT